MSSDQSIPEGMPSAETQPINTAEPRQEDTAPVNVQPADEVPAKPKRRRKRWLWKAGSVVLGFMLLIGLSGLLGYRQGINQRTSYEESIQLQSLVEQFELGLTDMEAGRYELARQRFEYVINTDPSYPGVTDKLAEVLLVLNVTATPTFAPTATAVPITPTPDTRASEELFAQAESHLDNQEWSLAIETLEQLRKRDPGYRPIDIDGMLFLALRQRGVGKINAGNLEGGIYDLTLAERFGVLDTEANNSRTWARYYIAGASFWGIDWEKAIEYFEQVSAMTPNLHNGAGWTASQRYLDALINYAEQLDFAGQWCESVEIYNKIYEVTGDPTYQEKSLIVEDKCR